ncbi:hypothetical protein SAMN00120144_0986 [Hymenobacter roseosalivarius DSM 11622]|uniref:DUF4835 domain-containing protein n=1 Tax=Hymenobacter roseosalivarius DSM 11622 TaxID=645990 RepID=A0A1W1V918_9BACT|nr:DUF4835 family protein [Hymenobacter roseosalivarius]SMB89852.1 hypothetical protein SAMN00120144_0986 [Hymenobacter roseosalivarius DSM 11622]
MRNLLFFFCCLFLLLTRTAQAQELLAEVSVTTENVTIADQQLVQQMRTDIQSFLNTRTWTTITYRPEERIRFRLFVGITGIPQTGSYQATARIITERPVYGTGYQTNLLSFADRGWSFNYSPQNPLDYSDNVFVSNLSSLLSFYAYIVIGMDQDSFTPLGGSPYYDRARNIMTTAASQTQEGDRGWRDTEPRNRYWLLNNLQDPQLAAFRSGVYAYYRQGLDIFVEKPEEARASVFKALQGVQSATVRRPGTLLARAFFDTKADEIANIFRTASDPQQKAQVVALLTEVDPTNTAKYQAIMQR